MKPDGTYTAAGAIIDARGHPVPFSGTFKISPHKPSRRRRVLAWLRISPR